MKTTWNIFLLILITSILVFGCSSPKTVLKGNNLVLCNGLSASVKLPKLNSFKEKFIELQHNGDTIKIIASYIYMYSSDMDLYFDGTNPSNSIMVEPGDCMKPHVNVDYNLVEKYLIISFENNLYNFERTDMGMYSLMCKPTPVLH